MERLTTRHNGVAVIRDKSKHKEAMEKLAKYEELEEVQAVGNLVSVKLSVFFEIKDAEIYGGTGSVGYAECSIAGGSKMMKCNLKEFMQVYLEDMAKALGVSESCVRNISEEEYKLNTEDEETLTEMGE